MRIFISADIEGVAGVTHLPTTGPGRFEWELGRRWMTGEVTAAIEGATAAGATEFVIADGHGTALNLLLDELPPNARVVRAWPRPLLQMEGIDQGTFDACVLIGHHAAAFSAGGVLSHSFTGAFRNFVLNGVPQSETTLNALVAAHYGAPTVFTSGDDDYIAHTLSVLPGVRTVVTKRALGYTASENLTPERSRELIRAGVEAAVRERAEIGIMPIPDRFDLEVEFNGRSQPDMLSYLPWIERTGAFTIRVSCPDADALMRFIAFISFYQSDGLPRYGEGRP